MKRSLQSATPAPSLAENAFSKRHRIGTSKSATIPIASRIHSRAEASSRTRPCSMADSSPWEYVYAPIGSEGLVSCSRDSRARYSFIGKEYRRDDGSSGAQGLERGGHEHAHGPTPHDGGALRCYKPPPPARTAPLPRRPSLPAPPAFPS